MLIGLRSGSCADSSGLNCLVTLAGCNEYGGVGGLWKGCYFLLGPASLKQWLNVFSDTYCKPRFFRAVQISANFSKIQSLRKYVQSKNLSTVAKELQYSKIREFKYKRNYTF